MSLETELPRLHARYVRDRAALVALCDGLTRRACARRRERRSVRATSVAARRVDRCRPYELYLIRHGDRRGTRRRVARRRQAAADRGRDRAAARRPRAASRASACRSTSCSRARWSARARPPTSSPARSIRARRSSTVESLAPGRHVSGGAGRSREAVAALAHRARRPRAGHRRAGRAADRLAPPDRVQEGRGLPDRRRRAAPAGPGALRWFLTPKILRSLKK